MALKKKVAVRRKVKTADEASTPAPGTPSREAIERRAYEIYQQRGRNGGNPESDWLQAERELQEQN